MKFKSRKCIPIVFILIFGISQLYSQNDTIETQPRLYKNSIKGIAIATIPIFFPFAASVTLGYERQVSPNKFIELCGYYMYYYDGMGNTNNFISLKPGIKFYTKKKKEKGPEFWFGTYLNYLFSIESWDINDRCNYHHIFGVGGSAGTRFTISKSRRWYIDLGFGGSINVSVSKDYYFNNHSVTYGILPRPIFQFGHKF